METDLVAVPRAAGSFIIVRCGNAFPARDTVAVRVACHPGEYEEWQCVTCWRIFF